jgi:hypothetical protein
MDIACQWENIDFLFVFFCFLNPTNQSIQNKGFPLNVPLLLRFDVLDFKSMTHMVRENPKHCNALN